MSVTFSAMSYRLGTGQTPVSVNAISLPESLTFEEIFFYRFSLK
jgi:hypothetical protein